MVATRPNARILRKPRCVKDGSVESTCQETCGNQSLARIQIVVKPHILQYLILNRKFIPGTRDLNISALKFLA